MQHNPPAGFSIAQPDGSQGEDSTSDNPSRPSGGCVPQKREGMGHTRSGPSLRTLPTARPTGRHSSAETISAEGERNSADTSPGPQAGNGVSPSHRPQCSRGKVNGIRSWIDTKEPTASVVMTQQVIICSPPGAARKDVHRPAKPRRSPSRRVMKYGLLPLFSAWVHSYQPSDGTTHRRVSNAEANIRDEATVSARALIIFLPPGRPTAQVGVKPQRAADNTRVSSPARSRTIATEAVGAMLNEARTAPPVSSVAPNSSPKSATLVVMAYRPHIHQPYAADCRRDEDPMDRADRHQRHQRHGQPPGSKSMTARALVLAAIATGSSTLHHPLHARDTELMAAGLRLMGTDVSHPDETTWLVRSRPLRGDVHIDVGLAGTVMRFLPPLAATASGPVSFDGDSRMRQRPLGPLVAALRSLGVRVDASAVDGLPMTVHGMASVAGGEVAIDASTSSQLVSGLLLAAPTFDRGLVLRHVGPPVPSTPHLRMTVEMLRAAGSAVDDSIPEVWVVQPGPLAGKAWNIEPDLSGAAPFLAAALVTGGSVTVRGWPYRTAQPGDRLREILSAMGGQPTFSPEGLTMRGTGTIHGIDADLGEVGELTPVIAALAALASTPSHLRGIGHIRAHETDRLSALARELGRCGAKVTELPDGLTIHPAPLTGATLETYADHRMAHAAAVIALRVPGTRLTDISCTTKTMPDFPSLWSTMVAGSRSGNQRANTEGAGGQD